MCFSVWRTEEEKENGNSTIYHTITPMQVSKLICAVTDQKMGNVCIKD